MLAPHLPMQNPQAIGALGGFCLKLRPLRRIGDVGGQGAVETVENVVFNCVPRACAGGGKEVCWYMMI